MQREAHTGGGARSCCTSGWCGGTAALHSGQCSAWPAATGSNDGNTNREACAPAHLQHRARPAAHHRLHTNTQARAVRRVPEL